MGTMMSEVAALPAFFLPPMIRQQTNTVTLRENSTCQTLIDSTSSFITASWLLNMK
jgi:hypothetical protein